MIFRRQEEGDFNGLKVIQLAFEANEEEEPLGAEAIKLKSQSEQGIKDMRLTFDDLERLLHVMSRLSGKPEYTEIATEVNEVIDQVNTNVLARSRRNANLKEEIIIEE